MKDWRSEFKEPPVSFGAMPFWFWSAKMDPTELARQVELMAEQGVCGHFMHARTGLSTPYLGPEWMDCIRSTVKKSAEAGVEAWLYDEDNWPSGFAGGLVSGRGPEYLQRCLRAELLEVPAGATQVELPVGLAADVVASFASADPLPEPASFRQLPVNQGATQIELPGSEFRSVIVFVLELFDMRFAQEAHIAGGYVDTLNPMVTEAFIETTYEAYKREVGEEFGKTVPGIFTDEPSYRAHSLWQTTYKLPWTGKLPEVFQAQRGYDLIPHLPALFFAVTGAEKFRLDFYRTVSDLFVESYTKPLYNWCEANGIQFTGHYLLEVPFRMATRVAGSVMHHYEYMHCPGVDHLGAEIGSRTNPWPTIQMRQLASVGRQLGKKRLMDEIFGCGGYNLTPARQRQMVDWQSALGINWVVPHAFYYSHEGLRKREYPPDDFYAMPWWPQSRKFWDYIRRISYVFQEGHRLADVLVIHPMESIWATQRDQFVTSDKDPDSWIEAKFIELENALNAAFIDHDYGEEELLSRHGKATYDGLRVGLATYKFVIVPPCLTLRESTITLLRNFVNEGGKLICLEPVPYLVDGVPDESLRQKLRPTRVLEYIYNPDLPLDDVIDLLEDLRDSRFEIDGVTGDEVLAQEVKLGADHCLFLVNLTNQMKQFTLMASGFSALEELDCGTGETRPVAAASEGGMLSIEVTLPPQASKLFCLKAGLESRPSAKPLAREILAEFTGAFDIKLNKPNGLIFDEFTAILGGEPLGEDLPVRYIHRKAKEKAAVEGAFELELHASFEVADNPVDFGPLSLGLEQPDRFSISLNGALIEVPAERDWLVQEALQLVPLAGVRQGTNQLVIKCQFEAASDLENAYLVGQFGVSEAPFRLVSAPSELVPGSFATQGLPFYAGSLVCSFRLQLAEKPAEGKIILELGRLRDAATVKVGGQVVDTVLWAPFEVDVTDYIRAGANEFSVEVAGDLFNFYGPHHHPAGVSAGRDPGGWDFPLEQYQKGYTFDEFGLLETPRLVLELRKGAN